MFLVETPTKGWEHSHDVSPQELHGVRSVHTQSLAVCQISSSIFSRLGVSASGQQVLGSCLSVKAPVPLQILEWMVAL